MPISNKIGTNESISTSNEKCSKLNPIKYKQYEKYKTAYNVLSIDSDFSI